MATVPVLFLLVVARGQRGNATIAIAGTLFGVFWIGFAFAHAELLRQLHHGNAVLFDVLIGTFLGDTAAYLGGRLFGRRPLAPSISPNKTFEGLFCGMLIAVLAVFFAGLYQTWMTQGNALLLGIAVAVARPARRPVRVDGQARRGRQGRGQRFRRPRRRARPSRCRDLHDRRGVLHLGGLGTLIRPCEDAAAGWALGAPKEVLCRRRRWGRSPLASRSARASRSAPTDRSAREFRLRWGQTGSLGRSAPRGQSAQVDPWAQNRSAQSARWAPQARSARSCPTARLDPSVLQLRAAPGRPIFERLSSPSR